MALDVGQLAAVVAIVATVLGSTIKIVSRLSRIETAIAKIETRCDERHNGPARRRTLDLQEQHA